MHGLTRIRIATMFLKRILSRVAHFLISSLADSYHVTAQIAALAPNELLKGRCALITGGTSGIGYYIAKAFINSGATVVITGRSAERNAKAVDSLYEQTSAERGKIHSIVCDNENCEEFPELVAKAATLGGQPVSILVNNAGIAGSSFNTTTPDDFDAVMRTNLRSAFFLSKEVAKHMVQHGCHGNILNIASASALRPGNSPYVLSKWGIRALTLGLAKTLTPHDIVVNGIAPGPTATGMIKMKNQNELSAPGLPCGRLTHPEEVASMAVILVGDMSRTIIGDIVYMTGGAGLLTLDDMGDSAYHFAL